MREDNGDDRKRDIATITPACTILVRGTYDVSVCDGNRQECLFHLVPYDPSVGESRIHYAGFFDPGFGYGADDIKGTHAVLEVRSHEVPFLMEDGQVVGRLVFERLLSVPSKIYGQGIGSSYQHQRLALSKQFRR